MKDTEWLIKKIGSKGDKPIKKMKQLYIFMHPTSVKSKVNRTKRRNKQQHNYR